MTFDWLSAAQTIPVEGYIALVYLVLLLALSRYLGLGLGRDWSIAGGRTIIQLIAIGYALSWIFKNSSATQTFLMFAIMTAVATHAAVSRMKRRVRSDYVVALACLLFSVWPLGFVTLYALNGGTAIADSALAIPMLGLLLGNSLTAISLAMAGAERSLKEERDEAETLRALGATPTEAWQRVHRVIVRTAVTPILNGMTVAGIVSLPGTMAGQLLAGVDPLVAARFQIVVMFSVALASMLGATAASHAILLDWARSWKHVSVALAANKSGLWLKPGDRIVLQGASGAGKSRLLRLMTNLVHLDSTTAPHETFQFNGRAIYLPQKPRFVPGTVEQNLQLPFGFNVNHALKYDPLLIKNGLETFGLDASILGRDVSTLSGGEAQIIHFLRALQLNPDVLLLDEPTASLDEARALRFEKMLSEWMNDNAHRSVLMISHDSRQASRFANQVWRMHANSLSRES